MNKILIKWFIKDDTNNKIGVLIAFTEYNQPDQIIIGFSLCNAKDTFNKHKGTEIAINRGEFHKDTCLYRVKVRGEDSKVSRKQFVIIPQTVFEQIFAFITNVKEKYPNGQMSPWVDQILYG